MVFSVVVSFIILVIVFVISLIFNNFMNDIKSNFEDIFVFQTILFLKADENTLQKFCPSAVDHLTMIPKFLTALNGLLVICILGYSASILQKLIIISIKDNIDFSLTRIFIEVSIAVSGIYTFRVLSDRPQNALISNQCKKVMEISSDDQVIVNFMYGLISQSNFLVSF